MRNLEIPQGSDLSVEFPVTDDDGQPVNVAGYHAKLQVRKTIDQTPASITLTQSSGITVGSDDGLITADFTPSDTEDLDPGRYLYDIYLKDTNDKVTKLEGGYFTIIPAITKDIS